MSFENAAIVELEKKILDLLREKVDGISVSEFDKFEANAALRTHVVNKLLAAQTVEMLALKSANGFALRLKRGSQIGNASVEEQLV